MGNMDTRAKQPGTYSVRRTVLNEFHLELSPRSQQDQSGLGISTGGQAQFEASDEVDTTHPSPERPTIFDGFSATQEQGVGRIYDSPELHAGQPAVRFSGATWEGVESPLDTQRRRVKAEDSLMDADYHQAWGKPSHKTQKSSRYSKDPPPLPLARQVNNFGPDICYQQLILRQSSFISSLLWDEQARLLPDRGLSAAAYYSFPFALYGMFSTLKNRRLTPSLHDRWQTATRVQLAVVCIAMPLMLSLITHKEVRFIYPLLPCLHVLAAVPLVQWFAPAVYYGGSRTWPRVLTMNFMILVNVVIARQEVNIAKFDDLKSRSPGSGSIPGLNMTAGFLMPCHSTPWRSHMVYPSIHAWALTCEPPINMNAAEKAIYRDEADQFYDNPEIFLATHMVGGLRHIPRRPSYTPGSRSLSPPSASRKPYVHEWPDYLVFFQQLEPTLKPLLRGSNYGECNRIYNSAWHDDWRRRGDVVVWCLDRQEKNAWRKEIQRRTEAKRDAHFDRVMSAIANRESGWGKLVPWHQEPFASILHFWREAVIPFLHVMRFFLTPFTLFGKAVYQGILSWLLRARSWVRGLISLPQTCGYGPWRSRNKYDIVMHHFGAKCPSLWQMSRRKIGEKIYGAQKWIVERFHIDEAFVVGDPRLRH
ncbi:hypothetical protein N7470_004670 [Penicillium chermesinum]|nr:hypothetical protein N7470_004670 [Penicillium chermesinum]